MPAGFVVSREEGEPQAAFDLDAGCNRAQEDIAGRMPMLGERQGRGHHRSGRVDQRRHVHVVEVERVRADTVDERRIDDVQAFAPTDHRRMLAPAHGCGHTQDRGHVLVVGCTQRTA